MDNNNLAVKSCSINTKQKSRETFITETIHRTKEILRGLLPDSISISVP